MFVAPTTTHTTLPRVLVLGLGIVVRRCVRTKQLDITFGGLTLQDNLLWNTDAVHRDEPEEFAAQTVAELKLPSVFLLPIAFAIREQVFRYQLHVLEHLNGSSSTHDPQPQQQPQPKEALVRDDKEKLQWGPLLEPAATAKLIPGSTLINCALTPFHDYGTVTGTQQQQHQQQQQQQHAAVATAQTHGAQTSTKKANEN